MRRLSLHQLTALDASPTALVAIAAALKLDAVCLFTYVPEAARRIYPVVARGDIDAMLGVMAATGLTLSNIEVFPLDRDDDPHRFDDGLAVGAALGATRATVHIHDADTARATARLSAFCDIAAGHGLDAGLEFNGFSAVGDVATAEAVVRGADRANGRIVLDLLHLVRSGGSAADVARVADLVDFVQLSDGPTAIPADKRWHEAISERMLPGSGAFPLADLLRPLRPETIIDIEVPQKAAMQAGVDAFERCRRAAEAARAVV